MSPNVPQTLIMEIIIIPAIWLVMALLVSTELEPSTK